MNTINVSAEIFRELGYIASNESSLESVLNYIRSLKPKSTELSHGAVYMALLEQLSDFQEYEQGWDGAGALPLSKKVVKNIKSVLAKTADEMLTGWMLSPETNGTILLKRDDSNAGINLGSRDFSYFLIDNGRISGENGVKFSVRNIQNVLKRMKR